MKVIGIIPARFHSTRFPGKPLIEIKGKTMISRVYFQARQATSIQDILVATDDQNIYTHCSNENIPVIMTSPHHKSGTDRVAEVAATLNGDLIINIQGDEPFISPSYFDLLVNRFNDPDVQIASLMTPIQSEEIRKDEDCVKAVVRADGRAMYFSRSPIPFLRRKETTINSWLHLGIYAFRNEVLQKVTQIPQGKYEKAESLEQLRWLEGGFDIYMVPVDHTSIGIDTPEDLEVALKWMEENNIN
jgi:3-deoxy-manno-octulosonate cytidylyltransferase (CMP-KDO synthetase)